MPKVSSSALDAVATARPKRSTRNAVIKHVTADGREWGGQALHHFRLLLLRVGNELFLFQWLSDDVVDTMHMCKAVDFATVPLGKLLLRKLHT